MINFVNAEDFNVDRAWAGAVQLLTRVGLSIESPVILDKILQKVKQLVADEDL